MVFCPDQNEQDLRVILQSRMCAAEVDEKLSLVGAIQGGYGHLLIFIFV